MFSPEQLKNRISKLGSRKSRTMAGLKYLLVLPLVALLLGISGFTIKKDYGLITINLNVSTKGKTQHTVSKFGSLAAADKSKTIIEIGSDTLKKEIKSHAAPPIEKRLSQNNRILSMSKNVLQKDTSREIQNTVHLVYHNGQVGVFNSKDNDTDDLNSARTGTQQTINQSKIDTTHTYMVKPVFRNGQVSVNRDRVN
jgi:hypothetical protein